jgi:ElaB/YqjD/DUF883 family membrane-anchored ribosome-binding protein
MKYERDIMFSRRKKNGHNRRDISARLNSMRSDLDALQENMRGLLNDVGGAAGDQVQGAMRNAAQSAHGAVDRVEEWGNESLEDMRKTVRGRPLASCALSIGAGALLGAILLRF